MARRFPAVANFLRIAGYVKVPGKRQYVSPSGQVVSRRQAEQRSGALRTVYGETTRERVTRILRPSGRTATREDFAEAYKREHNDPRAISTIMRTDPYFRHLWNEWHMGGRYKNLTAEERRRKLRAGEEIGWFRYDTTTRKWRYVRFG